MKRTRDLLKRNVVFIVVLSFLIIPYVMLVGKAEAITIKIWIPFDGEARDIMMNLITQFNQKHPDIKIEGEFVDWANYYTKLLTALAAGTAPDVAPMPLSKFVSYADQGWLSEIEGYVPDEFTDQLLENILKRAYYDPQLHESNPGHLYAIPIDTSPLVLYYNKTVLEEAGINPDKLATTWDELRENAIKLRDPSAEKWGFTVATDNSMLWVSLWISLYTQFFFADPKHVDYDTLGYDPLEHVDPETGKIEFCSCSQQIRETCEALSSWYAQDIAPVSASYDESVKLFTDGKAGYHFNGVWVLPGFLKTEGLDFGVTPLPAVKGNDSYSFGDGYSFVFPKTGDEEKLEAALTFAQWFSKNSAEWAKTGYLPVNKNVLESQEFNELPMRQDYSSAAKNAYLLPKSACKKWSKIGQQMWEIGISVFQEAQEGTPQNELKQKCIDELQKFFDEVDKECSHC